MALLVKPPHYAIHLSTIISASHVIVEVANPDNAAFRRVESTPTRKLHAEALVLNGTRKTLYLRLYDVRRGRSPQRQEYLTLLQTRYQLVLCARTGNPAELVAYAERTVAEIAQDVIRLHIRQFTENRAVRSARTFSRRPKCNRPSAIPADFAQQSECVIRGNANNLGNFPPYSLVGKKVGEERHHVAFLVDAFA